MKFIRLRFIFVGFIVFGFSISPIFSQTNAKTIEFVTNPAILLKNGEISLTLKPCQSSTAEIKIKDTK